MSLPLFQQQTEPGSPSSSPPPSGHNVTLSANTATDDDIAFASSTSSVEISPHTDDLGRVAPPPGPPSKVPGRRRAGGRHRSNSTAIYADNGFVRPTIGDDAAAAEDLDQSLGERLPPAHVSVIFVGNLPRGTRARDVRKFVQTFGLVVKVFVPRQPDPFAPVVASVTFADPNAASEAIDVLSHARAEGHRLLVRFADLDDTLDTFMSECTAYLAEQQQQITRHATTAVAAAASLPSPPARTPPQAQQQHPRFPSPPATFDAVRRQAEERRGGPRRM